MARKLITTIAAAAIAFTGLTATPASALSDKEALKLLLGAIALGVIVNELNDNGKGKGKGHSQPDYTSGGRYRTIPAECVFDVRTRNGRREVVGERCVEQSNYRGKLPSSCAFEARIDRRDRTVYGVNCLRSKGIRVEAARY